MLVMMRKAETILLVTRLRADGQVKIDMSPTRLRRRVRREKCRQAENGKRKVG